MSQKVLVLHSSSWFGVERFSVMHGPFEVKHILQGFDLTNLLLDLIGDILQLHGVAHQNQVNFVQFFNFDGENSINSSKEGVRVLSDSFEVRFEDGFKGAEFFLVHGFDDEFIVMGEEEKRAGFS